MASEKSDIAKKKLISIKYKTNVKVKELIDIHKNLIKIIPVKKINNLQNCRSMIAGMPNRIEFEENHLKFYIDFTITCQESEYPFKILGSIIYGTSRKMCFTKCPEGCTLLDCQRNVRCDGLEDKPLIEFTVGDDKLIKSSGILEDEFIIVVDGLTDLHFRTLVIIWKDALDWSNEKLIP